MANLTPYNIFSDVYQLGTSDPVQGGPGGIANLQAQQLANRTLYLKTQIESGGIGANAKEYSGDLDSLFTPGFYIIRSDATNKPASGFGFLLVSGGSSLVENGTNAGCLQIYTSATDQRLYSRVVLEGAPLAWVSYVKKTEFDSLNNSLIGSVHAFAMATVPDGFLLCNGLAVSRTTYANLFAKIGTTYGAGNGSTTFNVPELRGEFIRGFDLGRGVDSGRVMGSWQAEMVGPHVHTEDTVDYSASTAQTGSGKPAITNDRNQDTGTNAGTENRPRNVALLYCIKY